MADVGIVPAPPVSREIDVFGFKLNPMEQDEFLDFVSWHIAHRQRALITHLNMHGLAMMYESVAMSRLMRRRETVVTVDGMSLILLSRLAGYRLTAKNRVTSLDYIDGMLHRSVAAGWNIYYIGGKAETLSRGVDYLRRRYPGLKINGHHGYFNLEFVSSSDIGRKLLEEIKDRKVDLLIVGMGMPKQEELVESIRNLVDVPVILTIGAMLEYFAGSLRMPPRWLGPLGLEWLFRLATAPRRLAFRYLVEPFILMNKLIRGRPSCDVSDSEARE